MSYEKLFEACKKCFVKLPGPAIQNKCNEIWKELKQSFKNKQDLESATTQKIAELLTTATANKAKHLNWFIQVSEYGTPKEGRNQKNEEQDDFNWYVKR